MTIKVVSEFEITRELKNMIANIMETSCCPNESLIASIHECKGLKDGVVTIGNAKNFTAEIEY